MHRRTVLSWMWLVCLLSLAAHAHKRPELDVVAQAPRVGLTSAAQALKGAASLVKPGTAPQVHERFGVPTFIWASPQGSALALATLRASLGAAAQTPEVTARAHAETYAPLYGLSSADLASATVTHVHDLGRGATIVQLAQRIDGLEVFGEQLRVVMKPTGELVALSGFLARASDAAGAAGPALRPRDAVSIAFSDLSGSALTGGSFADGALLEGGYQAVSLAPTLAGLTGGLTQPARAKPVWFHLPSALVRAYYVEVDSASGTDPDLYAYVISAVDGAILLRHDLTQDDAAHTYTYRVYASPNNDPKNPGHPYDGPQGNGFDPHPSGVLDGTQPTPVPQVDLTMQSSVYSNDPWLPAGATETIGNNVEAYSDLAAPDLFTPSSADFHADLTGPQSFARTYDPSQAGQLNQEKAAVVQMFYNLNFFHDWYYVSGFTEAAGNAQANNYGRGGLQGDSINAEGQDYASRNNANMSTPADGARPRMRMYLFDGVGSRHLFSTGTPAVDYATGVPSGWGITAHDVTAEVVWVNDGVGTATYPPATTTTATIHDGCDYTPGPGGAVDPNWAPVTGKIALIDRGGSIAAPATCGFSDKASNATRAGALGVIIASTTTHNAAAFGNMGATAGSGAVTIAAYQLSTPDGDAFRGALANGPVTAHLVRVAQGDRDGTVDNQVMAHEWGHYISNRLVGNSSGLITNMSGGMGEGWADFHALLLTVKEEDAQVPSNAAYNGVYGLAVWVEQGGANGPVSNQGTYYGIRRMPYSTDLTKNNMTFKNIQDNSAVPAGAPFSFWPAPGTTSVNNGNSEVHNTGEVWATMLWECYAGILRDTVGGSPRLTFAQARERMKDYLVAGYKATPGQPTFLEARDALLSAIYAGGDAQDYQACLAGFAKRGAGLGASSPDRYSTTNNGVVESTSIGNQLVLVSASITDDVISCDKDGVLDSAETGTVKFGLRNDTALSLSGTTATVTAIGPNAASVSFPTGTTITFPPSATQETVVGSVQVALAAGLTSITQVDLQLTPADPQLPVQSPVTWSRRANYDDVLGQSATDDVESSASQFSVTSVGNLANLTPWFRNETSASAHSYKVLDQNGITDLSLISPSLLVGPSALSLSFKHKYSFEFSATAFFDGAVVELSTDNGNSWADIGGLASGQAYSGALAGGTALGTRRAFGGISPGYPAMVTSTIALGTTYAGQVIRVRFRAASDDNSRADGWEVDDIAFTGLINRPFPALLPNTCTANQGNRRPTVGIAAVAAQPERTTVTLTATAADADTNPLTLQWSQVSGPAVTLTPNPGNNTVSFTAPDVPAAGASVVVGVLAFDGTAFSALATRTVPISNVDRAPTVTAGADQAVDEKAIVQLGAVAADLDGDALTLAWTQTAGPAVTLSSASDATPIFVAPEVGAAGAVLSFKVTATANAVTANATVNVTVRNVNHAPVASAGERQLLDERSSGALSGSASDVDADTLSYSWVQVSPATPVIALSSASAAAPTFTAPEVSADTDFVFTLSVTDGLVTAPTSASVTLTVRNVNRAPVAVAAGPSAAVQARSAVTLDGTGSSDPDAEPLTWRWAQTAGPGVALSDPAAASPTFTAPDVAAATTLTFSLVVSDGKALSEPSTVSVTVGKANRKPTALAWGPASLAAGAAATLDGLGSSDPDGDALTYQWTQVSPASPAITFTDATKATPGFTAPAVTADTTFTFQLVVNDGSADSDPVTVAVPVQALPAQGSRPPVAQTGADLIVTSGDAVALDASSSSDPDGDSLSFAWRQLSGSTVGLLDATTSKPTFTAPSVTEPSVYGFQVTVSDGHGGTASNRMYVTVNPPPKSGCSVADGSSMLPMLGLALMLGARRRRA